MNDRNLTVAVSFWRLLTLPLRLEKFLVDLQYRMSTRKFAVDVGFVKAYAHYAAIEVKERGNGKKVKANRALYRGCGACSAACPSGVTAIRGFTKERILSQIEALNSVEL